MAERHAFPVRGLAAMTAARQGDAATQVPGTDRRPGAPGRTAVLHIGPMKTGSTSIQAWLRHHAPALRAAGVAMPLMEIDSNLSPLVGDLDPHCHKGRNPVADAITPAALRAALDALPDEVRVCVLSAEMMGQRMGREGVLAYRDLLAPYFDRFRVVVYLRRQDQLDVSRHSTTLRRGDRGRMLQMPLDYARILDEWADAFGRDALRPRLFGRAELVDGDVIADFVAAAELPPVAPATIGQEINPSLDAAAQTLLAKLGKRCRETMGTHLMGLHGQLGLIAYLDRTHAGVGRLPSRADAEAFLAQASEGNERVRREWFPERATLFDEDFSAYPTEATPDPPVHRQLALAHDVILALLAVEPTRRSIRRARRRTRTAPAAEEG